MIRYRLQKMWFDAGAVRRKPGIIYTGDDKVEDQLPSGAEILNDKNEVERVIERKAPATQKVVEVNVVTDSKAEVKVEEPKTEVKEKVKL